MPCFQILPVSYVSFGKRRRSAKESVGHQFFSRVFGRVTSIWRAFAWIYISVFILPNGNVYLVASYQEL